MERISDSQQQQSQQGEKIGTDKIKTDDQIEYFQAVAELEEIGLKCQSKGNYDTERNQVRPCLSCLCQFYDWFANCFDILEWLSISELQCHSLVELLAWQQDRWQNRTHQVVHKSSGNFGSWLRRGEIVIIVIVHFPYFLIHVLKDLVSKNKPSRADNVLIRKIIFIDQILTLVLDALLLHIQVSIQLVLLRGTWLILLQLNIPTTDPYSS